MDIEDGQRWFPNDRVYDEAQAAAARIAEIPDWVVTVIVNAVLSAIEEDR